MKRQKANDPNGVDDFLRKLGEPLDVEASRRSTGRVLERLRSGMRNSSVEFTEASGATHAAWRWYAGAAAALVLVAAFVMQSLDFVSRDVHAFAEAVDGDVLILREGAEIVLESGARIEREQTVRTELGAGAVLRLPDGSRIELSSETEISLAAADDGVEIRLASGSVIVSAARQIASRLYLTTPDCAISVVGTVFSVSAVPAGSRVSVIEGEVQVQIAEESTKLRPGEQMATNPAVEIVPLATELQWSRNAVTHMALLEQSSLLFMPLQTPGEAGVVIGFVRRAETGEGIPDAAITLCLPTDPTRSPARPVLPPRDFIGNIRISESNIEVLDLLGNVAINRVRLEGNPTVFGAYFLESVVCGNPLTTTTDRSGRFELRGVKPGEYILQARREGYFGGRRGGQWQPGARMTIVMAADSPAPPVVLSLIESGAISGRVFDDRGRPLPYSTVQAFERAERASGTVLRVVLSGTTDDRGQYRLYGLPPGEYYVAASMPRNTSGTPSPPTFYPAATDAMESVSLDLRSGREITRVDIDLSTGLAASMSGSVTATATVPVSAALTLVSQGGLQPENALVRRLGSVTLTGGRGSFHFAGIAPGVYDLLASGDCQATASRGNDQLPSGEGELRAYLRQLATTSSASRSNCIGVARIDMRGQDLAGIAISLLPRTDVSGRVVSSGAVATEDVRVAIAPASATARASYSKVPVAITADGSFAIGDVPPGAFRPEVHLPGMSDVYVSDVRQSGVSVLAAGFEVGAWRPAPLEVHLAFDGGSVEGLVEDGAQQPIAGARVILMPMSPRQQNPSLYPTATTGADGRFIIRGIAPGEHKAFAWRVDPGEGYLNASVLARFDQFAHTQNIAGGENIANLRLISIPDDLR